MIEPAIQKELAKWSETCPVCGGKAKKVSAPAFMFGGVMPWDRIVFCPKHGWIVIRSGEEHV